jgi:hypothetical protein
MERLADAKRLRSEFAAIDADHRSKRKELDEAEALFKRWETGNPVMVGRIET